MRNDQVSNWTRNVYAECFFRFRQDGVSLGGAWAWGLHVGLGGPPAARLQLDCALRAEGKRCQRRYGNCFLPRGETLRDRQESPSGLQMCMPSVSPGSETLPGCCASLSPQHCSRRPAAEAARGLISLCRLWQNTDRTVLKRTLTAPASVWVTTGGSPGLPVLRH